MPTNKEIFNIKMNTLANTINSKAGTTGAKDIDDLNTAASSISVGTDTSNATANSSDILFGKTAYARGAEITGNILSQASQTITPTTVDQIIPSGKYLSGNQTIKGDLNLISSNIADGVTIFGVMGTYSGGASLNIAYGSTAPSDTSKLWISGSVPDNILITSNMVGTESVQAEIASLPTGVRYNASASVGTKIYSFGGVGASSTYQNLIQIFDTETNTVSSLTMQLYAAESEIAVAAVGTKIYMFGGRTGSGDDRYGNTRIEVFNTETNQRTLLSAVLPTRAYGIAAAAAGTKIYLFGGYDGSSNSYINAVRVFDTGSNSLTTLTATLAAGAKAVTAVTVGTKIYLFGGNTGSAVNTIQIFDTETGTISTSAATLAAALYGIAAGAVGTNIYLLGGIGNSFSDLIQKYDTETDTIQTLTATLPATYAIGGSAMVGMKIYMLGGSVGDMIYSDNISSFTVSVPLDEGDVVVRTSTPSANNFNIINEDNIIVTVGVVTVYRGNSSNIAEEETAYLYKSGTWTQISGT